MAKTKKQKKEKKSGTAKKRDGLKALAESALVADIVAAALVAMASALKDSNRARALAADVGDELGKLSKAGSERGNALWDMALQIGRSSLDALDANAKRITPKAAAKKTGTKAVAKTTRSVRKKSAAAKTKG